MIEPLLSAISNRNIRDLYLFNHVTSPTSTFIKLLEGKGIIVPWKKFEKLKYGLENNLSWYSKNEIIKPPFRKRKEHFAKRPYVKNSLKEFVKDEFGEELTEEDFMGKGAIRILNSLYFPSTSKANEIFSSYYLWEPKIFSLRDRTIKAESNYNDSKKEWYLEERFSDNSYMLDEKLYYNGYNECFRITNLKRNYEAWKYATELLQEISRPPKLFSKPNIISDFQYFSKRDKLEKKSNGKITFGFKAIEEFVPKLGVVDKELRQYKVKG